MPSLIDATGKFAGNCLADEPPPPGYSYTPIDPSTGMDDPRWNGAIWVAGDPPPLAQAIPAPAAAWAALIVAPVYGHIYQLAQAHSPIGLEMALLTAAFHAHNLLPPDQWQASLSATCQRLANLVQGTTAPLTPAEQQWIEDWSTAHNLGLLIDWEAP